MAATTSSARPAAWSTTRSSSTSGLDASWRTAREPTAPTPTTATLTTSSALRCRAHRRGALAQVGAGQLPPPAGLGWDATGAAQPQHGSDETGDPEGEEGTTK